MPAWTAVLCSLLAGRGAVVRVAADGDGVAPNHLAVVAPAFEAGGVLLAVGEGVVVDFAVVEAVGEQGGDVAGGVAGADVLSVVAISWRPLGKW